MRHDIESQVKQSTKSKTSKKSFNIWDLVLGLGVIAGTAYVSLQYGMPVMVASLTSKRNDHDQEDQYDGVMVRRATVYPVSPSNVQILSQGTTLPNSALAILMANTTLGDTFTSWSQFTPDIHGFELFGQLHTRLNQPLSTSNAISQLAASASNPVLIANPEGYIDFWTTSNDGSGNTGIKYQYVTSQGMLVNPAMIELSGNANDPGDQSQVTAAAGNTTNSFSIIFQTAEYNSVTTDTDYQLEYRTAVNGVWQSAEVQFTQPSYINGNSGPTYGYNFYYFGNPELVRIQNTEVVLYLFNYDRLPPPTPTPPTPGVYSDIRYTANPSTATNAQGTSITSAYFPTATTQVAAVSAKVLQDNSLMAVYLLRATTAPAGQYYVYWQRFTFSGTTLTPIGTPQQIKAGATPFIVYDTTGPQMSLAPYGAVVSVASRHADGVTDQAYVIGFNTNGTIRFNSTRLDPDPQQYPETAPAIAVDNQDTIVGRWISTSSTGSQLLGVSRTADLEIVVPQNPQYTEDQQYYFGAGVSLPLNLPVGDNTTISFSIPADLGTLTIASPLPVNAQGNTIVANTSITTVGNTTTLTISAVPGTPLSLTDANTVAATAGFYPALHSRATVPVTIMASSDQYNAQLTYNLGNIPVNYPPVITASNMTTVQGAVSQVTSANLDATDLQSTNLQFNIANPQHCAFIKVADPALPLYQPGGLSTYPGTVVTSFTQQDIANGLIRFWDDGSTVDDSFTLTAVDAEGLTDTTQVTVTKVLNPAPQVASNTPTMVINQGGSLMLTSTYLNATQGNTPADQLTYNILQATGLTFQYWDTSLATPAWVNFPDPNNIAFTQADLDAGNQIQVVQDGTTQQTSFSFTVAGQWGATSSAQNANVALNPTPEFIQYAVILKAANQYQALTSSDISVQDAGAASQIDLTIEAMSGLSLRWANTKTALNVGDMFTQEDIDNGDIEISASEDSALLTLGCRDQYGATCRPVTLGITIAPVAKSQSGYTPLAIAGFVVSSVGFVGTVLWRVRTIYKEQTGQYGISPLGYLVSQAFKEAKHPLSVSDFSAEGGQQYVQAIESVEEQLALTHRVTFTALPPAAQQRLAKTFADYFMSNAGEKYMVTEQTAPPDASTLTYYMTKCSNAVFTTYTLNTFLVKHEAGTIATAVNNLYRDETKRQSSTASLNNKSHVEMTALSGSRSSVSNTGSSGVSSNKSSPEKGAGGVDDPDSFGLHI